jgi:hypothetical protein
MGSWSLSPDEKKLVISSGFFGITFDIKEISNSKLSILAILEDSQNGIDSRTEYSIFFEK